MADTTSIAGRTISHYNVLEKLGGGGMGVVYKAKDSRLGRNVALKFLPDDISQDAQAIERFRREARAASSLNHPNICTIYDVGEFEGRPFIAMELLEGQTLKHRISSKPMVISEILDVGDPDCRRIGSSAREGDRSPGHQAGEYFPGGQRLRKDSGFWAGQTGGAARAGLWSLVSRASDQTQTHMMDEGHLLTSPGSSIGTVAYMSPEQARGEELDSRSDLFSLGVVLYEMSTGAVPFAGTTVGADLRWHPALRCGAGHQTEFAFAFCD